MLQGLAGWLADNKKGEGRGDKIIILLSLKKVGRESSSLENIQLNIWA